MDTDRDTSKWEEIDWFDLHPFPGEFIGQPGTFEFNGKMVEGLNWSHAHHQWLKLELSLSGEPENRCSLCGQHIRYAAIWLDEEGKVRMTGEDCSRFINSKMTKAAYKEMHAARDIKRVKIKGGTEERCVLKLDLPSPFWDIPKTERPKFVSISKFEVPLGPRKGKELRWYISIWGATEGEVIDNKRQLREIMKKCGVSSAELRLQSR